MANAIAALTGGAGGGGVHVLAIQQLPPQQQLIIIAAVRLLRESPRLYPIRAVWPCQGSTILNRCCSQIRHHDAACAGVQDGSSSTGNSAEDSPSPASAAKHGGKVC